MAVVNPRSGKKRSTRGWYTISVETLRKLVFFTVLAIVAGVAFAVYRSYERRAVERDAAAMIAEVGDLLSRAPAPREGEDFGAQLADASRDYEEARAAYAALQYSTALSRARQAKALLAAILGASDETKIAGEAQFLAVHGGVEYRRGERGEWEEARSRVVLEAGDYVKTSSGGTAQVVFTDGTLYTVRPNTLFLVARTGAGGGGVGEQTIAMEYGWVNLATAQRGGRVTTPRAEARVARESEAVVSFDKDSATGKFAAYRGGVEVEAAGGMKRELSALQLVTQTGDLLSDPRGLPPAPEIERPADDFAATLGETKVLELDWKPLAGVARYALQVSRNRTFVDNVIDVENRPKPSARLEVRGEGLFAWRVAGLSRDGLRGPWSAARSFRVAARPGSEAGEKTPPQIAVDSVQSYGNIFIVTGRTDPGVVLRVNNEKVAVAANGDFTVTVQVATEGWSFLEFEAVDATGNRATLRRRVYVEPS